MIDIINDQTLTVDERRSIINRALWTNPYFYRIDIPIPHQTVVNSVFSNKLGINRDFYITSLLDNSNNIAEKTGAEINLSLLTGYDVSPYSFNIGKLPKSFITTDARRYDVANEPPPFLLHGFDDRQFETFPFLIKQNDFLRTDVQCNGPTGPAIYTLVVKGFNVCKNAAFGSTELQQINDSLSNNVEWQYFKLNVTDSVNDQGEKQYFLENDRYPRLILGLGALNIDNTFLSHQSEILVTLTDLSRQLQLTDNRVPLEYIAPRFTPVQDQHLYYLPIEYYWQPYAKLQFDIINTWNHAGREEPFPNGAEIVALTRTV